MRYVFDSFSTSEQTSLLLGSTISVDLCMCDLSPPRSVLRSSQTHLNPNNQSNQIFAYTFSRDYLHSFTFIPRLQLLFITVKCPNTHTSQSLASGKRRYMGDGANRATFAVFVWEIF